MPKVTVNGVEIEVDKGTSILTAAAMVGYEVPHFCYHPALSAPANCRMCLVEVENNAKLQPACYMPVNDGMVVHTENERVVRARKAVLEFILLNHPVDCPICDKAGECKLQDYYFAYDAQESRLRAQKQHKVKVFPIGPEIVYDGERCILCTRCIRFCEEISYTSELTLVERGDRVEVRTFPGLELDNNYSLCTVDVCPVGALTSRDFRFKCRVWLLTSTDSICHGCATGCNVHHDHFRNEVQRTRPRNNPEVNEYWMCDGGRTLYKDLHADDRLERPTNNGSAQTWHEITRTATSKLGGLKDEARIGVVLSPQASCEELFMARRFFAEALSSRSVTFYLGGKARGFTDKVAPGSPEDDGRIRLIDADKNPNTLGLTLLFHDHAIGGVAELVADLEGGKLDALYMMGHDLPEHADRVAELLSTKDNNAPLFVLHANRNAGFADAAHIVLPSATHVESQGTFVNVDGLAQVFDQAFRPAGEALAGWQIFMRLARGLGASLDYTFLHQIQDAMYQLLEEGMTAREAAPEPEAVQAPPAADDQADSAEESADAQDETAAAPEEDDDDAAPAKPPAKVPKLKIPKIGAAKADDDASSDGDQATSAQDPAQDQSDDDAEVDDQTEEVTEE